MLKELVCFHIDDDADDQEIFSIALSDLFISSTCVSASSGMEALDKLSNESFIPDYIFLDLNMPCMHGTECLEEIKKIPRLNHIPVIICSTSSDPAHVSEAKRLGAAHFLVKPTRINTLIDILSEFFQKQGLPFALNA